MNKGIEALTDMEKLIRQRKRIEGKTEETSDSPSIKQESFYGGIICDTMLRYTELVKIKYMNEDDDSMTLKDLINIIDGDTLLAVQNGFSDAFEGYPRDAETELHENVLNKRVRALYYSKIRSLIVIEV